MLDSVGVVKSWLLLFLLIPSLALADKVLVTETFDETDSTTRTKAQGQAIAWSSEVKGSIQVVNDPGLASGKAFKGHAIVGILPFVMMSGPGDKITVHFTFRLAGPVVGTEHGFKMGLFEGGDPNNPWFVAPGTGYRWSICTGPYPLPINLAKESGGAGQKILSGQNSTTFASSSAPFSINDTAKHTATITLREGDNGLNLTLIIDGNKMVFKSQDPLAPSTLTPTCFAIRSDANVFLFDRFAVTTDMKSGAASN
jgi:hypothetical protein